MIQVRVSIALAHAFSLSLIFSIIFEANLVQKLNGENPENKAASKSPPAPEPPAPAPPSFVAPARPYAPMPSRYVQWRRWFLHRYDAEGVYFFGILPRHTTFDLGPLVDDAIRKPGRKPLHPSVRNHLRFDYYPTLIITWTSLGLFFGVFLEGFLKGERLRGERR